MADEGDGVVVAEADEVDEVDEEVTLGAVDVDAGAEAEAAVVTPACCGAAAQAASVASTAPPRASRTVGWRTVGVCMVTDANRPTPRRPTGGQPAPVASA